jgi:hypothetical protein
VRKWPPDYWRTMMWMEWRAHLQFLLEEQREHDGDEPARARGREGETPLYPEGPPLEGYGKPPPDSVRRRLPGWTERPDLN